MQTGQNRGLENPRRCQSIKLVNVNGINPRISSGPAAIGAAHKGRTYDCTRPYCTNAYKNPCQTGASTYDNAHPGNVGFMEDVMNGIIYLVGLIVIIMVILTFLGLR
jgi:hypothetical protein